MKERRLLKHDFKWVIPHERKSRLPGTGKPHRIGSTEKRKPLFWVTRSESVEMKSEVYLINDSGEILEEMAASSGGYVSADEDILPVSSQTKFTYNHVQLGEAVKIEEYDIVFDSDFILGLSVKIKSKRIGHIELNIKGERGGVREAVLLWDTFESGNNVSKEDLE